MRDQPDAPSLDRQFRGFAKAAARDGAPLYRRLAEGIAGDRGILDLMGGAPAAQRRPTLLMAAVHYLLLAGDDDPLARHYPTLAPAPDPAGDATPVRPAGDPFPAFAAYCRRRRDALAELLGTRATQTNEVGRCTVLLPALATVAARRREPLSLVELGASAGLNLAFDRYGYTYRAAGEVGVAGVAGEVGEAGTTYRAGNPAAAVALAATLRGGRVPDLAVAAVAHRSGLDLDPVDPADEDRARWLLACQWPDHLARFHRLRAALALARATTDRPRVRRGDMVDDLPAMAAAAPAGSHLCIFHTWVAAYLPPARQEALAAVVDDLARARPVSWVFAESPYEVPGLPVPPAPAEVAKAPTALVLVEGHGGDRRVRRLADVHHHGAWLHWWG